MTSLQLNQHIPGIMDHRVLMLYAYISNNEEPNMTLTVRSKVKVIVQMCLNQHIFQNTIGHRKFILICTPT